MANDLATLRTELSTALRDTAHETWTSAEKDSLITQSINRMFPAVLRYVTQAIQLDAGASFISVGGASYPFFKITRIDLWDGDPSSSVSRMLMELPHGTWEIQGEVTPGTATRVAINPNYGLGSAYWILVHGLVPYNLTTQLVPDYLVPLVIARARAEAYRRMGADRARFKNWLVKNQVQNVSVNELINLTSEADREAETLEMKYGTRYKRPVTARR